MKYWFFKRLLLVSATSFSFFLISFCQDAEQKSYEILEHRAYVQIMPERQELFCRDTVTIRLLKKDIESIEFILLRFHNVKKISIKDNDLEYQRKRDAVVLEDIPTDSLLDIVFEYDAHMNFRTEFSSITADRAVLREEEIFPRGERSLRFVRFNIEVPSDWEAVATGTLVKQNSLTDSKLFTWEFDEPIPMVGWICAGKFVKDESKNAVTRISTYLFNEDSLHASRIISLTDSVLRFYKKRFTPYRFHKLAIIEVENWVAGRAVLAIAVPSIIMVKKVAFETEDEFNKYPIILAHEIAHQWWPATVFIEDRDAALLSEGMCEYSARLFNESTGQLTDRDSLSNHPLLRSLITRSLNGQDLPLQQKADLRSMPTHYLKASFVHNMLRKIAGDSLFLLFLNQYARRFERKTATLENFKSLLEELSQKKLDWFFDQWVKSKGIPRMKIYNAKATQQGEKWLTRGRVRMIGYDKFTTFVDVAVVAPAETVMTRVWLGTDSLGAYHNDVQFETVTKEKPRTARLDPNGDILKYQKLPVKLGDLRQPADGVMIVGTQANAEYLLRRARNDSSEMENSGWSFTIKPDTAITLHDLQNDRVFLYGKAGENSVVADQQAKFTHQVAGDTALINGEQISDSTLTLIQMIENPYIANGLLCWIAPLTPKAEPELLPYDHSWTLIRGKEEIASGTWGVKEEDVVVEVK